MSYVISTTVFPEQTSDDNESACRIERLTEKLNAAGVNQEAITTITNEITDAQAAGTPRSSEQVKTRLAELAVDVASIFPSELPHNDNANQIEHFTQLLTRQLTSVGVGTDPYPFLLFSKDNLMKTLFSLTIAFLIGFVAPNAAFAQRSGGSGHCQHSQPLSSGYSNTQSYGLPQYSPQAYMQNAYQQQQLAFMQRAYMQQAYLQQQSTMSQAAAEMERQIQADQSARQTKIREAAENRKAEAEKKRAKRAEKNAATKADKTKVDKQVN